MRPAHGQPPGRRSRACAPRCIMSTPRAAISPSPATWVASSARMRLSLVIWTVLFARTVAMGDPPARPRGECLRMWDTIVAGAPVGPNAGWFGPAQARYTWARLRARDKNGDGRISKEEFGGSADLFAALDRDGDGTITADDLDWSDNSQYARQMAMAQQLLRRAHDDGNKKVSK